MKNLSTRNKILTIKNLKKNYQDQKSEVKAIDNLTLDIYEKEFISIVGPSGCGKSTILSILSALEEKSGGFIYFNNPNIKVGYMLQNDSLFPWKTILENALLGLEIICTIGDEEVSRSNNAFINIKKINQFYKIEKPNKSII